MGVFPAASCSHVPPEWATLMKDPDSTIIDFYPEDFKIDLNGKKFAWQGVALLPFVDEKRLFKALEPFYEKLSEAELKRNVRGDDRLYVSSKNSGYALMSDLYKQSVEEDSECAICIDGMRGTVLVSDVNVPECGYVPQNYKIIQLTVLKNCSQVSRLTRYRSGDNHRQYGGLCPLPRSKVQQRLHFPGTTAEGRQRARESAETGRFRSRCE